MEIKLPYQKKKINDRVNKGAVEVCSVQKRRQGSDHESIRLGVYGDDAQTAVYFGFANDIPLDLRHPAAPKKTSHH